MNAWSWYWTIWFAAGFVAFAIPEAIALFGGHAENTLSANVWRLEQFLPGDHWYQWTAVHVLLGGALLTLFGWLAGHFVFGLWR